MRLTSEVGSHSATALVTDLFTGYYGLSYQTTRAGWYRAEVKVESNLVIDGAFRVYVSAVRYPQKSDPDCFQNYG